ncbi:hypothetical protein GCM10007169_04570 [Shewanella fodinae]|nr:hypothetical protein GCM10007169_04570 [Shewanella fodinae]
MRAAAFAIASVIGENTIIPTISAHKLDIYRICPIKLQLQAKVTKEIIWINAMTTLTKEEVISQLEAQLSAKEGKKVTIEQSGSWYKIDGGKSLRFSELELMLTPDTKKSASSPKTPAKSVTKQVTTATSNGGKTPKEIWREKLAANPSNQLPRGF